MPTARVHATRCHSLQIVVCATLNLLVMLTMAPLWKRLSMYLALRMEIASNLCLFVRSFFLTLVGGPLFAQTSMPKFDFFFASSYGYTF